MCSFPIVIVVCLGVVFMLVVLLLFVRCVCGHCGLDCVSLPVR